MCTEKPRFLDVGAEASRSLLVDVRWPSRLDQDRNAWMLCLGLGCAEQRVRQCVKAIVAGVAALAFGGDVRADSGASGTMTSAGGYVEEVIVTADRLERGAIPTQTIIVQTYSVRRRAMRLYDEQRYGEALPLLLLAAKRGFKWPQAMAGDILLHGRGEVDRDLESGIGWLGVAAAPQTEPEIDTYFRQVLAEFPERQRKKAIAAVRRYRQQ